MQTQLCVVGAGRSGAVTAACLADMGNTVHAVDVNAGLVAKLNSGSAPFYEAGLDGVIARNLDAGRLSFTTSFAEAVPDAHFVMLCVGTPAQRNGDSDLSALAAATEAITPLLDEEAIVILRSTVPVGTNAELAASLQATHPSVRVVSNPEFLREGHAVEDFMRPDRIVIGATDDESGQAARRLYNGVDCPTIFTDLHTAEVIKYAANASLAASISFINEIANICDRTGADVADVSKALSLDPRIGPDAYLAPGIGFGGSCLPKDLYAIVASAERLGYSPPMLRAIIETNEQQPERVAEHLEELFKELNGLKVAVLGISFKGGTFDLRDSPAMKVIESLSRRGADVRAFDPHADETARAQLGSMAELFEDAYRAAEGCSAIVVATEHAEFRELDLKRLAGVMASAVLIDGRNLLDPDAVASAGFSYIGIGRPRRGD